MTKSTGGMHVKRISVFRTDPEMRFGIPARGGMSVNSWFCGILALLVTIFVYVVMMWIPPNYLTRMLLERGPTQHAAVFLAFWCTAILLMKRWKLKIQSKALRYTIIPSEHDFVLTSQTADQVVQRIREVAEDPERFLIFNRILIALASLKNLGRVSDADDILRSLGDRDESSLETSFSILNGFLWAIPVLGFIGTVLGLSISIATFSQMLESQEDVSGIIGSLRSITGGLSTAFETTLLALVLALLLQLWMTAQKKSEEEFLDECHDYCLRQIVSHIKILPYEQSREV